MYTWRINRVLNNCINVVYTISYVLLVDPNVQSMQCQKVVWCRCFLLDGSEQNLFMLDTKLTVLITRLIKARHVLFYNEAQFLLVKVSKPYLTAGQGNPRKIWSENETNLEADYEPMQVVTSYLCEYCTYIFHGSRCCATPTSWRLGVRCGHAAELTTMLLPLTEC